MTRVTITRKEGGTPQMFQPQCVETALEILQKLPGFGKGTLKTKCGFALAPGKLLEGGKEYVFVPKRAGKSPISSFLIVHLQSTCDALQTF